MSVLASFPHLLLHLHPGPLPTIETEWQGFASSSDFRRCIQDALALAQQHGVKGWIANDQQLGAVRPVDLQWVAEYVLPTMVRLGIRRFARLESGETMNRMLIGSMYQKATPELPIEFCTFATLQQARAWASGLEATGAAN